MALSEREQQVLRDLEDQLHDEAPDLEEELSHPKPVLRFSPRRIGGGIALVLVGLAVVIAGVWVGKGIVSILLGVAGFGLAVWGVSLALTRTDPSAAPEPASGSSRSGSSFMARQEARWDERQER